MVPDAVPTPMEERPTDGDVPAVVSAVPTGRRKFLTRGVAGGSVAALVAGKPVKTLAKAYCKFSGWNSVKVTKKKGKKTKGSSKGLTLSNSPKQCSVKIQPPSYYFKKTKKKTGRGGYTISYACANWPLGHSFNGYKLKKKNQASVQFGSLFGSDPVNHWGYSTVLSILTTESTTVEAYMIAVAFASLQPGFPLTPAYVLQLWDDYANTDAPGLLAFCQQLV